MSKKHIVYMAGPITGLSFDGATDWRDYFKQQMPDEISAMSPMRGKSYLKDLKEIFSNYEDFPLSSSRGIITRDYNDCKRCDVLVANLLGAKKVSIGTVMEISWAKAFQTPVIVIMEHSGNPHDHPMINECTGFRVQDMDSAITIVKTLLLED